MARKINVLPDTVANQIAAGEVVERPASVVKELVENALDAGATSVQVHIEGGGKRLIRVSDDGEGMSREDALICLDRHATSKIREAAELRAVRTFGFRGEALPSIAAVSRLTIETCEGGREPGTEVRSTGGRILDAGDAARQRGTTVEVKRLFFNAPARAKFLKATRAESRAVSEAVQTLALANPDVGFLLTSDERTLLDVPAGEELPGRIARIWGDEAANSMIPVVGEAEGRRIWGVVQRPDAAETGVRRSALFVGRRPFRDTELVRAVDRGYRTTIPAGTRPWFVLHLEPPEGDVDVNVHPAKAEVRFQDPEAVQELVESTVREAMAGESSSASLDQEAAPPEWPGQVRERHPAPESSQRPRRLETDSQTALFVSGGDPEVGAPDPAAGTPPAVEPTPTLPERPRLWQVHRTWIMAETRDGLLIIDQHSAHERVMFERLMKAYGEGGETSQRLLFPLTIRLRPEEVEQLDEVQGLLSRAGFEVEAFGADTVLVQAVPNPHPYFDAARCFREMMGELAAGTSDLMRSAKNQHERIAMTFACKGSVKAGQRLSENEMQELFDSLFATELPHHDVHGRPTIVRLSRSELERKFGR